MALDLATQIPLPARAAVGELAVDAVTLASRSAAALVHASPATPDPTRVAVAFSSERWFRIDGVRPAAFAPLSGFFRTADGWVRTHGNYPHHAAALRSALLLSTEAGSEETAAALARRAADEVSAQVTALGGLCVPVSLEDSAADAVLRATPLVQISRLRSAPPVPAPVPADAATPLHGVRVLDLTRVIAGPIATRTLALLGADVLRVDPPHLPEIGWQHLDTGHGKRSTLLDLSSARGRARFDELLATADIVALGYRPAALRRLGLSPEALAARRPGLIVLQHSAWGDADARGFDSLVQAATGIAWLESSDGVTPGALPAQALDHTTGYLLAAAAMDLLRRRADEGGSWLATTSLRRVAAELLGMPRAAAPASFAPLDATGHIQTFRVEGTDVTTAAPAIAYAGAPAAFAPPRPWGADAPRWQD